MADTHTPKATVGKFKDEVGRHLMTGKTASSTCCRPQQDGVTRQPTATPPLNAYPMSCGLPDRSGSARDQINYSCSVSTEPCSAGPFKHPSNK